MSEKKTGLDLMREDFPPHQISSKPQGNRALNDCPDSEKIECKICGGWHHPRVWHLDYVGHAALTDRLLESDIGWSWEPLTYKDGLPGFDATGGLWIKLTVCGVTRLGYGNAAPSQYKEVGSREKEVIGDALRNAAMRFGAALELWHKGDLHKDDTATVIEAAPVPAGSTNIIKGKAEPAPVEESMLGMVTSVTPNKSGRAWAVKMAVETGEWGCMAMTEAHANEARALIGTPGVTVTYKIENNHKIYTGSLPF